MSWSMALSTLTLFAITFRKSTPQKMRTASSTLTTSPKTIGTCTASHGTPGPSSWTCAPGTNAGKPSSQDKQEAESIKHEQNRGILFRRRQPHHLPGLHTIARNLRTDRQPIDLQPMLLGRRVQSHRQCLAGNDSGQGSLHVAGPRPLRRTLWRAAENQSALPHQHAYADACRHGCAIASP